MFNQTPPPQKEGEWEGERKEGRDKGRINIQSAKCTSLVACTVKNLPWMQEAWVPFLGQEDPWRREWQSTPVFLPGEAHGRRSLVGYSP